MSLNPSSIVYVWIPLNNILAPSIAGITGEEVLIMVVTAGIGDSEMLSQMNKWDPILR